METIKTHKELRVYQAAFQAALEIYQLSKNFPAEEKYSLTDQVRRSSRSVAANIAEAYRKRKYPKHFVSKLSDAESEAAETQVWLDFAKSFNYVEASDYGRLYDIYDHVLSQLVLMANNPDKWCH